MRKLGPETLRSHDLRHKNGFYSTYMSGKGLDIGFRGDVKDADPVLDTAIGIDLDYEDYNGTILPFETDSQDYVFSSHCLEHIENWVKSIQEWHRVLKIGGHLILIVPHKYLYEKKRMPKSNFNSDHKRFYTNGTLLTEVECALEPNSYKVVFMETNDAGYDYTIPPESHASGAYEIILVIRKQVKPIWELL